MSGYRPSYDEPTPPRDYVEVYQQRTVVDLRGCLPSVGILLVPFVLVIGVAILVAVQAWDKPKPPLIICDTTGHITQSRTLETAVANAELDNRRLAYRLGRLTWATQASLEKAEGCP